MNLNYSSKANRLEFIHLRFAENDGTGKGFWVEHINSGKNIKKCPECKKICSETLFNLCDFYREV